MLQSCRSIEENDSIRFELSPLRRGLKRKPKCAGLMAGPLEEHQHMGKLFAAGFEAIEVELTRIYTTGDAFGCLKSAKLDAAQIAATVDGKFKSALRPRPQIALSGATE